MSLLTKLRERFREYLRDGRELGYGTVAVASVFRRLSRYGFHVDLVQLGTDDATIAHPRLPPGYTARPAAVEELLPWVDRITALDREFLEGAIARGDRCVVNFFHDELVGFAFVTRSGAPHTDQLEIVIDDWLVYRYKGWTHPEHRRKHLSHARGRINWTLFPLQPGMRSVSIVALYNLASKLHHADIHPVRIGYCGYLRLFGREYPFTSRVARRYGFRLQRRARRHPEDPPAPQ